MVGRNSGTLVEREERGARFEGVNAVSALARDLLVLILLANKSGLAFEGRLALTFGSVRLGVFPFSLILNFAQGGPVAGQFGSESPVMSRHVARNTDRALPGANWGALGVGGRGEAGAVGAFALATHALAARSHCRLGYRLAWGREKMRIESRPREGPVLRHGARWTKKSVVAGRVDGDRLVGREHTLGQCTLLEFALQHLNP